MDTNIGGIIDSKYLSCAHLALQLLAKTGISTWQDAFQCHIANAKVLGLMPDDIKVLNVTLSKFNFSMQSTQLEDLAVRDVVDELNSLKSPCTAFLSLRIPWHLGGYMIAARFDSLQSPVIFGNDEKILDVIVSHVWVRFDKRTDRSPYTRRIIHRQLPTKIRTIQETDIFKPFQPNPCSNHIGDCVIRGIAGALDISWCEAMDRLASVGETPTVNSRDVYPKLLKKEGFIHHKPIVVKGRHLDGRAFCDEMQRRYHHGERIFAQVGRCHVAAIIPTNRSTYKICDSWDSSGRYIGEYWLKPTNPPISGSGSSKKLSECFSIGDTLRHPTFGDGKVTDATHFTLTVDFGTHGTHRLGSEWTAKNCTRLAREGECDETFDCSRTQSINPAVR